MKCTSCGDSSVSVLEWPTKRGSLICPACGKIHEIKLVCTTSDGKSKAHAYCALSSVVKLAHNFLGENAKIVGGKVKGDGGTITANVRLRLLFPELEMVEYVEDLSEETEKEVSEAEIESVVLPEELQDLIKESVINALDPEEVEEVEETEEVEDMFIEDEEMVTSDMTDEQS